MGWVGVWDWSSCQAMVGLSSSRRIGVGFGVGVLARLWLASEFSTGWGGVQVVGWGARCRVHAACECVQVCECA